MQKGVITMCFTGGLFIIGDLIGSKMLRKPRVFSIMQDGKQFNLSVLPGVPEFMVLENVDFKYPIPGAGDNIHAFYKTLLRTPDAEHAPKTEAPMEPIETMRDATPEEQAAMKDAKQPGEPEATEK